MKTDLLQQNIKSIINSDECLIQPSFPSYAIDVEATTILGDTGIWMHGDLGWYPEGKWGKSLHPHNHIASWKYLTR